MLSEPHLRYLAFGGLAALALVACRQDPPPTLDALSLPESSSVPSETPRLAVTPTTTCSERQVVTVSWNDALVAAGPLELRVDSPSRPLFATVAAAGSKETGDWARRGMAFVAIAPDGGVVARAVVGGPDDCE